MQTLTDSQRTALALLIAEGELEHGVQQRPDVMVGVLACFGINGDALARATELLRRPTLTLVH